MSIIYFLVIGYLIYLAVKDFIAFKINGFFPPKRKNEVGLVGGLCIIGIIIFTLIWGGIFWW